MATRVPYRRKPQTAESSAPEVEVAPEDGEDLELDIEEMIPAHLMIGGAFIVLGFAYCMQRSQPVYSRHVMTLAKQVTSGEVRSWFTTKARR